MSKSIRSLAEIDRHAREVLARELGIVDTLRFLGQFPSGSGNYTAERRETLDGLTLMEIVSEIKGKRKKANKLRK